MAVMDDNIRKNPWLGLESYREGEVLYGRDDDIRDLSQSVLNDADTLLYGKSGIGKSSILNAGIIPAARRSGFMPVMIRLSHKKDNRFSYMEQIRGAIADALLPVAAGGDSNDTILPMNAAKNRARDKALTKLIVEAVPKVEGHEESMYEFFHRHRFYNTEGERLKLLLIFDQFEEIFTLQGDEMLKKDFFSQLADHLNQVMPDYMDRDIDVSQSKGKTLELSSLSDIDTILADLDLDVEGDKAEYVEDNEIHMVFTIREDFLSEFEFHTAAIPSLRHNRYGLRPLNEEQAAQIIMRPIPGLISEDVAVQIIQQVTGRSDFSLDGVPYIEVDSAVLSLYLNRLYDAKTEPTITSRLVEEKSGEIINDFYNDAISEISPEVVEYLEENLLNGNGRRDNITIYDAINDGNMSERDIDTLCNKKKILRQFNYAGDLRIEFVHDILCPVVKAHKEEREQQQEQERQRLEQERQIQEMRERAEAEQKRLRAQALRVRRRNRIKLALLGSFVAVLAMAWVLYFFYDQKEFVEYYSEFEIVDGGWPKGVGKPLKGSDLTKVSLYYRLSHKGWKNRRHHTDIEVRSASGVLPAQARIPAIEVTAGENDKFAKDYYNMLSKVVKIKFIESEKIEGENRKIERQEAKDKYGKTLFVINYFHMEGGKESWAYYQTATGEALKIRDSGVDRKKITWYRDTTGKPNPNNGRLEYVTYYDNAGTQLMVADSISGIYNRYNANERTTYYLDDYGLPIDRHYNVVIKRVAGDTVETRYARASTIADTLPASAIGDYGYNKEVDLLDGVGIAKTLLYIGDEQVATRHYVYDDRGNIIEKRIEGKQPVDKPAKITYKYKRGFLVEQKKFDADGKPFISPTDSINHIQWDYDANGELTMLVKRSGDKLLYSHTIETKGNVKIDIVDNVARGKYLMQVDSTLKKGTVATYFYARDMKPTVDSIYDYDNEAYIGFHKKVVENNGKRVDTYYYTLGDDGTTILPCPTNVDNDHYVTTFYHKIEIYDSDKGDRKRLSYQILDSDDKIIVSMLYFYQNGRAAARAAMGVDGTPVRCKDWEAEGLIYYKIWYNKDFDNNFTRVRGVNEWNLPSIFNNGSYQQIIYNSNNNYKTDKSGIFFDNGKPVMRDYFQSDFVADTTVTTTNATFLHVLDKKSDFYVAGLRDGDRVIALGSWRAGQGEAALKAEWLRAKGGKVEVKVLRPIPGGKPAYETITKTVSHSGDDELEHFHFYALTLDELKLYNQSMNKRNSDI